MIWNPGVERLPRDSMRAMQLERLRAAVAWAGEGVAFSRSAFAEAGVELLRAHVSLNPEVAIVPPKTIPRSEGKAARVVERS